MNNITNLMKQHKSIRQFSNKEISEEIIHDILLSARQQPSSIGAQQASVIVIKDKEVIKTIAHEVCGGQPQVEHANTFMVVCIDYLKVKEAGRLNDKELIVTDQLEGFLTGAVDAGIMVEALQVAAEGHGLGAVMIGAVRNNIAKLIELLSLPKYVFPIVGISMGYRADGVDTETKPRLALETYAHREHYSSEKLVPNLEAYNEVLSNYNNTKYGVAKSYSDGVSGYYSKEMKTGLMDNLMKQGFNIK